MFHVSWHSPHKGYEKLKRKTWKIFLFLSMYDQLACSQVCRSIDSSQGRNFEQLSIALTLLAT